jgi:hypothetical protein
VGALRALMCWATYAASSPTPSNRFDRRLNIRLRPRK